MVHRYGYYLINSSIEDVWNRNLDFWQRNRGTIKEKLFSENSLYREIKIHHNMSMKVYATSMGETYEMKIGYNPKKKITYVFVHITFSRFGKGFVDLIPKNMMKLWAENFGIAPVKLEKEQNPEILDELNEILDIGTYQSNNNENHDNKTVCPQCGSRNEKTNRFCITCGIDLRQNYAISTS